MVEGERNGTTSLISHFSPFYPEAYTEWEELKIIRRSKCVCCHASMALARRRTVGVFFSRVQRDSVVLESEKREVPHSQPKRTSEKNITIDGKISFPDFVPPGKIISSDIRQKEKTCTTRSGMSQVYKKTWMIFIFYYG